MKVVGFSLGITRLDRIKTEHMRGTAVVQDVDIQTRVREARLRCCGCIKMRTSEYIGRRMWKSGEEDQRGDSRM